MLALAVADQIAAELVAELSPYTANIAVAGSIRRRRPEVRDIEIVAVPADPISRLDLFGNATVVSTTLHQLLEVLRSQGVIRPDAEVPRWGQKYRRFSYRGATVDLFIVEQGNWGYQLVLRTGPAAWNVGLVTPASRGGLLPPGVTAAGGYLRRGGQPLQTPTEQDVFELLGLPWVAPEERSGELPARVHAG